MADLRLNIQGEDNASSALGKVSTGVLAAGAALTAFAAISLKASEEQAKADRQLAQVAGTATQAFKDQASALQSSLGVSDDHVQKLQTMLLRYGEAPSAIDGTVRAILDMSAATGQDAVGAISALTSSVTTGRTAFKDLGLDYDKHGTRSQVLASATKALAAKFHGSAEAEGNSLTGSVLKASQQFGELQETFGFAMAQFATKTGIIDSLAEAFRGLNTAITGGDDQQKRQKQSYALQVEAEQIEKSIAAGVAKYTHDVTDRATGEIAQGAASFSQLKARLIEIKSELKQIADAGKAADTVLSSKGPADHGGGGGGGGGGDGGAAAAKKAQKISDDHLRNETEANQYSLELQRRFEKSVYDENEKFAAETDLQMQNDIKNKQEIEKKAAEQRLSNLKKADAAALAETKHAADLQKAEEKQWAAAGDAIAGAFVNAISDTLNTLSEGGEVDFEETATNFLATVLQIAGTVIGTIYGSPQLGAAIGGLAGTGLKAGVRAARGGGAKGRRHLGGWAGDDMARYHTGTWVGTDEEAAILQHGERVLSQSEVAGMGGRAGVDRAVKGGASNVTIQTFDAGSFREIFQGRGGRGITNAVRTGQGVLPALLGGGL